MKNLKKNPGFKNYRISYNQISDSDWLYLRFNSSRNTFFLSRRKSDKVVLLWVLNWLFFPSGEKFRFQLKDIHHRRSTHIRRISFICYLFINYHSLSPHLATLIAMCLKIFLVLIKFPQRPAASVHQELKTKVQNWKKN